MFFLVSFSVCSKGRCDGDEHRSHAHLQRIHPTFTLLFALELFSFLITSDINGSQHR